MSRRKLTWIALVLGWIVVLIVVAVRIPTSPTAIPIPNPNGHDDFVEAGSSLRLPEPESGKVTSPLSAEWVATNKEALQRFRLGLSRPCVTPPLHTTNLQTHLEDLAKLRNIGRLLAGTAEAARLEQDWDRMITLTTEGLDFSLRLSRGGVLIDEMMARAIENQIRIPLERAVTNLPAGPARKAALALNSLDASRIPFSDVLAAEDAFALRSSGWTMRIAWRLFLRRRAQAMYVKQEQKWQAATFATRNLILNLAARAYTVERGQPPASPDALVPDFLPAVPHHPLTTKPLQRVYSITAPQPAQIPIETP